MGKELFGTCKVLVNGQEIGLAECPARKYLKRLAKPAKFKKSWTIWRWKTGTQSERDFITEMTLGYLPCDWMREKDYL